MHLSRILIAVALAVYVNILPAKGQCSSGNYIGPINPVPGPYQTMPVVTGDLYNFWVPATCIPTYDFSFCAADGGNAVFDSQITILDQNVLPVAYNDDFCGTQSHLTFTPLSGGTYYVLVNTKWCAGGDPGVLAFRAVDPPLTTFVSATTVQASANPVTLCDADQEILRMEVNLSPGTICGNFTVDQFRITMNGSTIPGTNANDVSNLHIYYTGNSPVMSSQNEFVPGGMLPAPGTMNWNGSQTLQYGGTNYFWLCYDPNGATGTPGNLLDAECLQITINGTPYTPAITSPGGSRTLAACSAYPGAGDPNFKLWLDASTGVTVSGGLVTQWDDISGAGITGNFTVLSSVNPWITPQTAPVYVPNILNGNAGVRFDGLTSSLASSNLFLGSSLYDQNFNTIMGVVKQKSGVVWYKWEDNAWGAHRVGFETNGNALRFDFDDDVVGKNNLSTTSIAHKDVIFTARTDPSFSWVSFNSNMDGVKNITGISFTPDPVNPYYLAIGNNELSVWEFPCEIDMYELIQYDRKLVQGELRMVETYLAVKYGITLGNNRNNGSSLSYFATNGFPVWVNKTGYHNYVIGIGRDNTSSLNQLKSTSSSSLNGTTDVLTISNGTNFASPSAFGVDRSYFICGNNNLQLMSTASSILDVPPGIMTRLERVWQGQESGTVGTITLEYDLSNVPGPSGVGTNNLNDVRLLVSQNGVFAPPATIIVSPSFISGSTVRFQFDFTPATGYYFTIGSVNWTTAPLPVVFDYFSAGCDDNRMTLKWRVFSETNNDYFSIDRSSDGMMFENIALIPGSGTTSQPVNYQYIDEAMGDDAVYYALSQTDYNGQKEMLSIIPAQPCASQDMVIIAPNPASEYITIRVNASKNDTLSLKMYDQAGRLLMRPVDGYSCRGGMEFFAINLADMPEGIFLLHILLGEKTETHKFIRMK
ncbi:MAG: hypothetical protein FD123_1485 [Bacteroidetes bacterium]|nr:MAG: hypothetical protein FD123_1485 [Bacteroidota bacterium]